MKNLIMATALMLAVACSPFSTPIIVEFSSAPQLSGGEAVILGGQVIGRAERPRVRNGVIEVVVNLRHNDSLKDETLFVLDTAPNYGTVLVAIPRGSNIVIDRNSRLRFRGAASRAELAMMLTKDNIGKTIEWLNDTISAAIQGLQQ